MPIAACTAASFNRSYPDEAVGCPLAYFEQQHGFIWIESYSLDGPVTLTPDQQKDLERTRAYVAAHQLVSVMSDTKWRRMRDAVRDRGFQFRRKDVRESEPADHWDGDFYHVFGGGPSIEWIEIRTLCPVHRGRLLPPQMVDRGPEIQQALRSAGIPFERSEDRVRVYGYTRPGAFPEWVE